MAKRKIEYYYYVLVLTMGGPVFVTGEGEHKTAFWNKDEPPMEFGENYGESMAFGLMVNGYQAFLVKSRIQLSTQPYMYDKGEFKWDWFDAPFDTEKVPKKDD